MLKRCLKNCVGNSCSKKCLAKCVENWCWKKCLANYMKNLHWKKCLPNCVEDYCKKKFFVLKRRSPLIRYLCDSDHSGSACFFYHERTECKFHPGTLYSFSTSLLYFLLQALSRYEQFPWQMDLGFFSWHFQSSAFSSLFSISSPTFSSLSSSCPLFSFFCSLPLFSTVVSFSLILFL